MHFFFPRLCGGDEEGVKGQQQQQKKPKPKKQKSPDSCFLSIPCEIELWLFLITASPESTTVPDIQKSLPRYQLALSLVRKTLDINARYIKLVPNQ